MRRFMRSIAVMVGLGSTMVGLMPGCSNRLGPVIATQEGGIDRPTLPDIFVDKAKGCVTDHGAQLGPGRLVLDSTVEVDEDGLKWDVTINNLPETASDFGACMRIALQDMPIAEEPFRQGVDILKYRREQIAAAQRSLVGHPVVIVVAGVTIVVSEVVLEAGAVTILFAVTVKVIDKAKDDVMEAVRRRPRWKRNCDEKLVECLMSSLGRLWGNVKGSSRCIMCYDRCDERNGWPAGIKIDDDLYATCQYN